MLARTLNTLPTNLMGGVLFGAASASAHLGVVGWHVLVGGLVGVFLIAYGGLRDRGFN